MEWLTTQQLAGLPEMNETSDGVRRKAKRENWKSRKKPVGKGMEYHISSLPKETQKALNISAAKKATLKKEHHKPLCRKVDMAVDLHPKLTR